MREKKRVLRLSIDEFVLLLKILPSDLRGRCDLTEKRLIAGGADFNDLLQVLAAERQRKIDLREDWSREAALFTRLAFAKERKVKVKER